MGTVTRSRTGQELRASRRRRMADDIELVALRLFADHGVDEVTVDDIADAADISRRTFFRYFSSKDDVLYGNPERQLKIVHTALDSAPATASPRARVRAMLLALAIDFEDRREVLLLRKRIAAKTPDAFAHGRGSYNTLQDAVIDALAAHMNVDADIDPRPRVYVLAGFGALQAAARMRLTTGSERSLEAATAEALDLIHLA